MSNPSKKDIFREWLFHQKTENLSRRNFLANAGAGAAATVFLPSILSLLTRPSISQAASPFNPFVVFDCVGGGTFAREVLPLDQTLSYLSPTAYASAGLPVGFDARATGAVIETFGAPIPSASILAKALTGGAAAPNINASAAVRASLKIMTVCNPTVVDDNSNATIPSNQAAALAASLGSGMSVPSGVSDTNSNSGAKRGLASQVVAGYKPAQAASLTAIQGLTSLKQGALSSLSDAQMGAMVNMSAKLTVEQKEMLSKMTLGKELGTIAEAAGQANIAKVANATTFDGRNDTLIAGAYGINGNTLAFLNNNPNTPNPVVTVATQVKLLTDGFAPVMVKSLDGFDYHDGTATTWKARHLELINQTMQMLNAFAAKGVPVMIQWNTDGATRNNGEISQGDGSQNHSSVVFVLSMNGAPAPKSFQIGAFTSGGAASSTTPVAGSATNEGHAIFANLAAFQGKPVPASLMPTGLNPDLFNSFKLF